ncbi:MAG: ABC transporter ATP-binding protein/permease [Firmicutes bacterium]|nr:ABC transporter ATP-binding protein/permease [Bacillota bacterium]
MLRCTNLRKTYQSKKCAAVKALHNVSIDFGNNGLIFILGKSGSGKSTLLNLLGGIDMPDDGEIIIQGNKSSKFFSPSDFDSYRNTHVGFIFQEYNLIPTYTVGDNIKLALELQGKQVEKKQIETILQQFELINEHGETLYNKLASELSGGQKQRVAIARALVKNPEIILADEPTGALDSETGTAIYDILKVLSKDKLIIVVTHDYDNAKKYADRMIELKDGVIINDSLQSSASAKVNENAEKKYTENDCKLVKSKLPFKRSFYMGASGLKNKKSRLIISMLLSIITFIIFGFSITASATNEFTVEIKTLYANNYRMVTVNSSSFDEQNNRIPFTTFQMQELTKYNNAVIPTSVFVSWRYQLDLQYLANYVGEDNLVSRNNPYLGLGLYRFEHLAEIDFDTGTTDLNLKIDDRFVDKGLCRLPQAFNEIAITDIRADMFIRFGYKSEDGTVIAISTPDDLIGKTIGEFTISGIYSTEQDKAAFQEFDIDNYNTHNDLYSQNLFNGARDSIISYGFVRKGFLNNKVGLEEVDRVLIKLSGDINKDKALFNKLNYKEDTQVYSVYLTSAFSAFMTSASFFKDYLMLAAIIVAVIFFIFSALLAMNFLSVSIDFKKNDIGILRALGARRKDILAIFLTQSLIISCIEFIVSLIAVTVLCVILNSIYFISIFNIGILQVALLFLLCFGVAVLATVLPIIKITNKKPIEIINNK